MADITEEHLGTDPRVGGLSNRRKAAILATCCLCSLITGMDLTIANLAIPSVRTDLAASAAHTQWVIAIYALVIASLQLLGGAAGDRFGRRRVLQTGLAIFMLGSLLCSLAPVIDALIAARALQAVGASMMNPVALANHRPGVHRTRRKSPRDRHLGFGIRSLGGARARRRRSTHRPIRLAFGVLDQPPGRCGGHRCMRAVRTGEQIGDDPRL